MNKILTLLTLFVASVSLTSCHDDEPSVPAMADRTVIIYMMAENSLSRFAAEDLNEMAGASAEVGSNTNVVIYMDDTSDPVIYTLTARKGLKAWRVYAEDRVSTDSLVMLTTLQQIVKSFPARAYNLTLWSHGTGWVPQSRSIGVDNGQNSYSNSGLQMDITTLRAILEQLPHMEMVFFDACLMQSIEVAYELKDVTDYMVGSPSEIPGNGAPYHLVMPWLVKGDARGLAQAYYEYYKDRQGVALGVADCRRLDALAEAMAPLVQKVWSGRREVDMSGVQYYSPCTSESGYRPEPYDIEGVMHSTLGADDFALWQAAWEEVDVYHAATDEWSTVYSYGSHWYLTDPDHYSGMSMFVPEEKHTSRRWMQKLAAFRWYKAVGWDQTGW